MKWLAMLLAVPLWLTYILLGLVLTFIGLPLIWWQSSKTENRYSTNFSNRVLLQFKARWMWLWCNDEDGIDGLRGNDPAQNWWDDKTRGMSVRGRIFKWAAIRNPCANVRFVPILNPKGYASLLDVHTTGFSVGNMRIAYYWHGIYSGMRLRYNNYQLDIGWKLWTVWLITDLVPFATRLQQDVL